MAQYPATINLSSLDASTGTLIAGIAAGDGLGRSVAHAGDVNGDGFLDLIVGASGADNGGSGSGSAYVVFGSASGFGAGVDLSGLNGTNGFRMDGESASDSAGYNVAAAGDVNGDGFDDVIVSAPLGDPHGA